MNIVVHTAPATEPLTLAEVMAYCRIGEVNQEPAPGAITAALASPAAPGNVTDGVHRYLCTFVTADGETQAGTVSSAVTVADKSVNGQVALSGIPLGSSLVTARKIYRTAAGGATYLLLATLSNNTATTYTDNIADAALGAGAPSTNTTSDPLLRMLITAARRAAELNLHRYLITQTLDAYLDQFPCDEIRLPPLQSVTSITYTDTAGETQTLAADQYRVDAVSEPARITPAYGTRWPVTLEQTHAVIIRFVAGYGAAAAVPETIKHWMLLRIQTLWENRDQIVIGTSGMVELPPAFIDGLLDDERVQGRI